MFVLCHTGPSLSSIPQGSEIGLSRALVQRSFIQKVLKARIAVCLLNEVKYVDSKVSSLKFMQRSVKFIICAGAFFCL